MSKSPSLAAVDTAIKKRKDELVVLETDRAALANYVAGATADLLAGDSLRPGPILSGRTLDLIGFYPVRRRFGQSLVAAALTCAVLAAAPSAYSLAKRVAWAVRGADVDTAVAVSSYDEEILEIRRWFIDGPQTAQRRQLHDRLISAVEAEQALARDAYIRLRNEHRRSPDVAKPADPARYRPLGAEGVRRLGGI